MSITGFLKIPTIISTAIGTTGLAAGVYSIISDGHRHWDEVSKEEMTEHYMDMYLNNQSSFRDSSLVEDVKKYTTDKRMDSWLFPLYYGIKNTVITTFDEIINNSFVLGASLTALAAPRYFSKKAPKIQPKIDSINKVLNKLAILPKLSDSKTIGKKIAGVASIALILNGIHIFGKEVLGIGKEVN